MWISKKRWETLEKKVADLEKKIQNQPLEIIRAINVSRYRELTKSSRQHPLKE